MLILFVENVGNFQNDATPIGGVHGKFGFLMIILSIGHIAKRI